MRMWTACLLVTVSALGGASASPLGVSLKASSSSSSLDLTLLHINDMHARFEQTSQYSGTCSQTDQDSGQCYGGFSRVATQIKEARQNTSQNTLVLYAGDTFQGTVYYSIFKWNISAHFMNWLDFDALTLGNHEFDDHVAGLVPYVEALENPLVVANLDYSEEPKMAALNISKSVVLERDGVKIGVVGYVTPDTTYLSSPDDVIFKDEVAAVQEEVDSLVSAGVNIIIGLGHSGYDVDKKIAAQVPEMDLVIGGHSHSFLYTGTQPDSEVPVGLYPTEIVQASGKKVYVVQAYAFTKYMGKLRLTFDANGNLTSILGEPVLLNKDIEEDPETLAEVERWKTELNSQILNAIGSTEVLLDYTTCRQQECNIGNLVADSFVSYRAEQYRGTDGDGWTDAPIALVNSGAIRSSIDASENNGTISIKDLMEVLPYDNLDVVLKIRGSVLRQALEHSVDKYVVGNAWQGQFLQMSGVRVVYDVGQSVGSRVVSVQVKCGSCDVPSYSDLEEDALYGVIVNAFVASGGDDYTMLTNFEDSEILQETDYSILQMYVEEKSPLNTGIEGRITIEDTSNSTTPASTSTPTSTSATTSSTTKGPSGSSDSLDILPSRALLMIVSFIALKHVFSNVAS